MNTAIAVASNSLQANCSVNQPSLEKRKQEKVKKVRRKPRQPKSKGKNVGNRSNGYGNKNSFKMYDCDELSSALSIQPICVNVPCVFIRKRSTRFKYIKLHTFTKESKIPVVFKTELVIQKIDTPNIEDSFSKLNISESASVKSSANSTPINNYKTSKNEVKSKNNKTTERMKGYISKSAVEDGLKNSRLVKGIIRINPKNPREAYVSNDDRTVYDYIIPTMHDRNGALEGDEVVLEVQPQSDWKDGRPTATVVYILKKVHSRFAIGHLQLKQTKNQYLVELVPRDKRIPRIQIQKISWPPNYCKSPKRFENALFLVQIIKWENIKYATGMITEHLGISGDLKVETEIILKEHCLDVTPYTIDETNICLKHFNDVTDDELKFRKDLRDECVFTIDPDSARDLDDAVSCKPLSNGNFEIGVHISDVSFYLDEGTVLDEKAKQKATTVYLVNNTYHMLPLELCMECSLLPGSEKRTFSVFWEMTPDGHIISNYFTRSIIKSCTKLAYEHAQLMIENPTCEFSTDQLPEIYGFTANDVSNVVNNLNRIAKILRERRFENGALRIDQQKLVFNLNPKDGQPEEWSIYEIKDAHRMIEEFMLLANMTVAAKIKEHFPDLAFLRCHEPPIEHMLQDIETSLEMAGIFVDTSSSGSIQSTLWKYSGDDYLSIARMMVLNHLFTKPMKRAKYFCAAEATLEDQCHHYALNIPLYTHFTSPIRRYADIMVHRLLAASLDYTEKPNWTIEYVEKIAKNCNVQKYNAKKAGDASIDLYLAHYIETHQPFIVSAVVVDVRDKMFEAIVLKTGSVVRLNTNEFEEGIKWKSTMISKDNDDSNDTENNGKKMWKLEVTFPPLQYTAESTTIIIERFTIVKVALTRKMKTNKLEARLVAPIPTISFSNNGESNFIYNSDSH